MGLVDSALLLIGIGVISKQFGAGTGLFELGEGIESLSGAPLRGIGGGLGEFGTGLRGFASSLGDIGRGIGDLLAPFKNGVDWGLPYLAPSGGGDSSQLLPGGGGSVTTTKRYMVNGYASTMPYLEYRRTGETRPEFRIRKLAAKEFMTNAV